MRVPLQSGATLSVPVYVCILLSRNVFRSWFHIFSFLIVWTLQARLWPRVCGELDSTLFERHATSSYLPHVRAFTLLYCEWHVDPCALSQSFFWLSNIPLSLDFARFVFVDLKVHWSLAHVVWLGLRVTSCILLLAFISQFVYLFFNHPISIPFTFFLSCANPRIFPRLIFLFSLTISLFHYLTLSLSFAHPFCVSQSHSIFLCLIHVTILYVLCVLSSLSDAWPLCLYHSGSPPVCLSLHILCFCGVKLRMFCVSVVWNGESLFTHLSIPADDMPCPIVFTCLEKPLSKPSLMILSCACHRYDLCSWSSHTPLQHIDFLQGSSPNQQLCKHKKYGLTPPPLKHTTHQVTPISLFQTTSLSLIRVWIGPHFLWCLTPLQWYNVSGVSHVFWQRRNSSVWPM